MLPATALHLAWRQTATSVSRELVDVLELQITAAVRREWWGVVGEVERPSQGMRDLLDQANYQTPSKSVASRGPGTRSGEILNEHEPES